MADWLVQPQLNRLTRADGEAVQLEPKMMDVLVRLARTPGEVVSREALIDAVWPEVYISESVLTRAIAGLRRALGDDARRPRFIETISKRGYRLIVDVETPVLGARTTPTIGFPGGSYVVGQWVRAEGFYGRAAQLDEVLDSPRNGFWVVGTRRRGKTSFLKQLEHLAESRPERGLIPVFWDLQGVDDLDALAFSLEEALADAETRIGDVGVTLGDVLNDDVFRTLAAVRRRMQAADRRLLLLCDEAEALKSLTVRSEAALGRLRRALLARDGVRAVMASGPRLWDLATGSATSPFLDGFLPPLYLGALDHAEARALVLQRQLGDGARPDLTDAEVEEICRWGGGHPFLLQLLSKRAIERGDVSRAVAAVAGDRSVSSLFEVDLELLDDGQRRVLDDLAHGRRAAVDRDARSMFELCQLGLVDGESGAGDPLTLPLMRDWLVARDAKSG
ncbi:MAG: transcriptional regulator [Holophagae bacterium]